MACETIRAFFTFFTFFFQNLKNFYVFCVVARVFSNSERDIIPTGAVRLESWNKTAKSYSRTGRVATLAAENGLVRCVCSDRCGRVQSLSRWYTTSSTRTVLHSPCTLHCAALFPPENLPLIVGGWGLPSSARFLGPTRPTTPNGIQIQSAVLPQYTLWTDRPADRQTDRHMGLSTGRYQEPLTLNSERRG